MALIAVAADKGAPGATTASVALAAVWPRPVLLAECDPSGGDLVYRLPAASGGRLDPRRGLLSLAVAARRGLQPHQVWEHAQKLHGGLDVLTGVSGAEQGAGLELLWGSVGKLLAGVPQADVIADCGRIGVDGPVYDLLAHASSVVLVSRATLGDVIRLRDRASVVATALQKRGRPSARVDVVVVADYKHFSAALAEVSQALRQSGAPARVIGGLAHDPKSADQLRGEWGGKLDKSMLIRTARAIAADLVSSLPQPASGPAAPAHSASGQPAARQPAPGSAPPGQAPAASPPGTAPQRQPAPRPQTQQPYPEQHRQPYPGQSHSGQPGSRPPYPASRQPESPHSGAASAPAATSARQYGLSPLAPRTPAPGQPAPLQGDGEAERPAPPWAAASRPPEPGPAAVPPARPPESRGRHAGGPDHSQERPQRLQDQPPPEPEDLEQAMALPPPPTSPSPLTEPGPQNPGRPRAR